MENYSGDENTKGEIQRLSSVLSETKKATADAVAFLKVAPPAGLEPATYGLTVRRSTN